MGKKRVTYDLNDAPKYVVTDHHHHHHHHHRHHNHQKSRKIKPEAKLLHTLNSHLKKLTKSRSRNNLSRSHPPPTTATRENSKRSQDHLSCWLIKDNKDNINRGLDWFMGLDCDLEDAHFNNDIGVFEFGQDLCWKKTSFIGSENNEDLFGGDCVFTPDLNANPNVMLVFEDDGYPCGSYILPDSVMNLDNRVDGKYFYEMLELSSQEDMINEFIKVNLFGS